MASRATATTSAGYREAESHPEPEPEPAPPPPRLVWGGAGRVRAHPLTETSGAELADGTASARLRADGYLLCRDLLPREDVLAARAAILRERSPRCPSLLDRQDIAAMPEVRRVLEAGRIKSALERACGEAAFAPVAYKWLRAVGPGLFTGVHMDKVYFPDIDHR